MHFWVTVVEQVFQSLPLFVLVLDSSLTILLGEEVAHGQPQLGRQGLGLRRVEVPRHLTVLQVDAVLAPVLVVDVLHLDLAVGHHAVVRDDLVLV